VPRSAESTQKCVDRNPSGIRTPPGVRVLTIPSFSNFGGTFLAFLGHKKRARRPQKSRSPNRPPEECPAKTHLDLKAKICDTGVSESERRIVGEVVVRSRDFCARRSPANARAARKRRAEKKSPRPEFRRKRRSQCRSFAFRTWKANGSAAASPLARISHAIAPAHRDGARFGRDTRDFAQAVARN
jgi:hypothetical protein